MTKVDPMIGGAELASRQWLRWGVLALVLISLAPLLAAQAGLLWQRWFYHYFPLAILVTLYFVWVRGNSSVAATGGRRLLGQGLLVMGTISGLIAATLYSPWLAHFTTILVAFAWMLIHNAKNRSTELIVWLAPLVIFLPVPGDLQDDFIRLFVRSVGASSSHLLDIAGLPHLLDGNVLTVRTAQWKLAELFHDIDSPLLLLTMALTVLIAKRSSCLIGIHLLLFSIVWSWAIHTVRLTTIVLLTENSRWALVDGWQQLAISAFSLLISACVCILVCEALETLLAPVIPSGTDATESLTSKLYFYVSSWPWLVEESAAETTHPLTTDSPKTNWLAIGAVAILAVTVFTWLRGPLIGLKFPERFTAYKSQIEATFKPQVLPETHREMTQVDFEIAQRPRSNSGLAEHSVTWHYRWKGHDVTISFEFPFTGFHPTESEYVGNVYRQVDARQPLDFKSYSREHGTPVRVVEEVRLEDALQGECYLLYAAFDCNGKDVWRSSAGLFVGLLPRTVYWLQLRPVTYQLQLHLTNVKSLSNEEREYLAQVLLDFTKLLLPKIAELGQSK